jgi:hypothetical protein
MQMAALASSTSNVWRYLMASPPHFVHDHILAISAWVILYMAESAGVAFQDKAKTESSDLAINTLAALPRLLVPSEQLAILLLRCSAFQPQSSQVVSSAVLPAAVALNTSQRDSKLQERSFPPKGSRLEKQRPTFVPAPKQRTGLKPGEWDPNDDFNTREEVARRSYLQDMYYCVAALPKNGLTPERLYEAQVMSKKLTYWQGVLDQYHLIKICICCQDV